MTTLGRNLLKLKMMLTAWLWKLSIETSNSSQLCPRTTKRTILKNLRSLKCVQKMNHLETIHPQRVSQGSASTRMRARPLKPSPSESGTLSAPLRRSARCGSTRLQGWEHLKMSPRLTTSRKRSKEACSRSFPRSWLVLLPLPLLMWPQPNPSFRIFCHKHNYLLQVQRK